MEVQPSLQRQGPRCVGAASGLLTKLIFLEDWKLLECLASLAKGPLWMEQTSFLVFQGAWSMSFLEGTPFGG